ncbi:Mitochondrial tRNAs modification protein [Paecilomyces lecythidis]
MYAARASKPKLSLSISAVTQNSGRPSLSLKSPGVMPRTPTSPSPLSPTARNTRDNQRGYQTLQVPTYTYANSSSSKSILKKSADSSSSRDKRIQFQNSPTVYCVTPIENKDDVYGGYVKMSRDERRWGRRSDDTSVSIVEKHTPASDSPATIHFLENVTADTRQYRGIHPIEALQSHQESLANLVDKAIRSLPPVPEGQTSNDRRLIKDADGGRLRRIPDFISATRGPGMRSNLSVGLDTGKGLAVAWQVPFVGVHHMQAHLLTPRLVSALTAGEDHNRQTSESGNAFPDFPFLSILVSGGHSLLVKSSSVTDHSLMASSADIAIGEALDKSARLILPESLLQMAKNTMYGKILEQFAFPGGPADYSDYRPAMTRGEEQIKRESPWGWSITTPLANTRQLQFSFSCVPSTITRLFANREKANQPTSDDERVALARESMRVCFEHLASRTVIALEALRDQAGNKEQIKTLVVSGGVAANRYLMTILRSFLDVRGFGHVELVAPPPYLCTDNAAMIGWAGIEMFEAGWRTELSCRALRKWSLDSTSEDGGVLGPSGWTKV